MFLCPLPSVLRPPPFVPLSSIICSSVLIPHNSVLLFRFRCPLLYVPLSSSLCSSFLRSLFICPHPSVLCPPPYVSQSSALCSSVLIPQYSVLRPIFLCPSPYVPPAICSSVLHPMFLYPSSYVRLSFVLCSFDFYTQYYSRNYSSLCYPSPFCPKYTVFSFFSSFSILNSQSHLFSL
jgi:hypothetical protein